MLALACRDCTNLLLKEFWRENLQRLKDWRGGFGWRQVANGGFGRGAPSRPIINHTATEPNYMINHSNCPSITCLSLLYRVACSWTWPRQKLTITWWSSEGNLNHRLGETLWGHVKEEEPETAKDGAERKLWDWGLGDCTLANISCFHLVISITGSIAALNQFQENIVRDCKGS